MNVFQLTYYVLNLYEQSEQKGLDSHLMELLQRQIHMQIVDSIHFTVQENFKISFRKRALRNKLFNFKSCTR